MIFELPKKYTHQGTGGVTITDDELVKVCGKLEPLSRSIGEIKLGHSIHFITNGAWALHDLAAYLLRQTGAADMRGFTWSLSIPAAIKLIDLKKIGLLRKMWMLTDINMKKWSSEAVSVLTPQCEKIVFVCNHSKGFLLENDDWKVSVISSANFSNNPRIEAGCISTDPEIYAMHREWLDATLDGNDAFKGEPFIPPPLPSTPEKTLFLIRGYPGCGKSALAHQIADEVYEEDDFFIRNGKYEINLRDHSKAAATCFSNVRDAMERGVKRIAAANDFPKSEQLQVYYDVAREMGYWVHCIVLENRLGTKSLHTVSDKEFRYIKSNFEVKL